MKKVVIGVTLLMGLTMSLILSLIGTLMGGHFTLPSWLMSFGISLVMSLIIGFAVPVKKLGDSFCGKCHAESRSLKGTLLSSIISDLIYTPAITIVMVVVMLKNAAAHAPAGAAIPSVGQLLVPSLLVCLAAGYIAIFIFQPLYVKLLIGRVSQQNRQPQPLSGQ